MRGRGDSVFTRIQEILLHSVCEKTVMEKIIRQLHYSGDSPWSLGRQRIQSKFDIIKGASVTEKNPFRNMYFCLSRNKHWEFELKLALQFFSSTIKLVQFFEVKSVSGFQAAAVVLYINEYEACSCLYSSLFQEVSCLHIIQYVDHHTPPIQMF